jgi:hypothetical protein
VTGDCKHVFQKLLSQPFPACRFLDIHLAEFGAARVQWPQTHAADNAIHGILHYLKASPTSEIIEIDIVQVGIIRPDLAKDAELGTYRKQYRSDRGDVILGSSSDRERTPDFGIWQHGNSPVFTKEPCPVLQAGTAGMAASFGRQETTNPAGKAGFESSMDGCQNMWMSYEERRSRSSWQVVRWILHDLPSIAGCRSKCCQPSNEVYHSRGRAVKKTTVVAVEIPDFRPLLRFWKSMPKRNLDRIVAYVPSCSSFSSGKPGLSASFRQNCIKMKVIHRPMLRT